MTSATLTGEHIRVSGTDIGTLSYVPWEAMIVNGQAYSIDGQTPCGPQMEAAEQYAAGRESRLAVRSFGTHPVVISRVDGSPHVARIRMVSAEGGQADTTDPAILALAD